jgi:hypothetical protein
MAPLTTSVFFPEVPDFPAASPLQMKVILFDNTSEENVNTSVAFSLLEKHPTVYLSFLPVRHLPPFPRPVI